MKIGAGPLKEFQVFWVGLAMLALFLCRPLLANAQIHEVRPPGCRPADVQRTIFASNDIYSQAARLQSWIERCEDSRSDGDYHPLVVLEKMGQIKFDYRRDQRIQPISTVISGGIRVQGLLGIQTEVEPRPLVIVRCGVFCDADNSPVTALAFLHFFGPGPFHVLLLGSASGPQFARDNGHIFVSGVEEGAQTIEVIEQFRRSPKYSSLISDIHLVGMSLGGHGTLYASRYALLRPQLGIRSAMAICPVVDLESQMIAAQNIRMTGRYFEEMVQKTFARMSREVPSLRRTLGPSDRWNTTELPGIISRGSRTYLGQRQLSMASFGGMPISSDAQFWEANRFQRLSGQPGVPTLVLHAFDDEVVPSMSNAVLLKGARDIGVISMLHGSHCAFSMSTDWDVMTELFRSFVLSHSSRR